MITESSVFLFNLSAVLRYDILAWLIGLPLVVVAVVSILIQLRQTRRLREELAQLATIKRHTIEYDLVLKTMKLAVWHLDVPTRTITFGSDYRDLADTVVIPAGTSMDDFNKMLAPGYEDKMFRGMMDLIEGRTDEFHEQYEIMIPHSGQSYWGKSYATVDKRDMEGKPLTVVGTSLRIDRQKEIERALIEARNHAEESDRLKSAFLANMSHEVRTPLNAIVGFSEVLPMAQDAEEREKLIGLIRQNNAHLLRLFDDMVNMSKLEAGGDAVKKTHFELKSLLEEIMAYHQPDVDASRVVLKLQPNLSDVQPYTDRTRLGEILKQYVNNAVKFTAEGSITLGYDVNDDVLRVWVRDTGKGIPEEHCNEHLFERFFKVDEFVPGTGLGLSICRSMAQSLGGRVGVQSTEGKGSLFWVEIPVG